MGLGFLDDLFCEENTLLIVILLVVVVLLLSNSGDDCGPGFSFGKFNLGDNWLLIVIVLLCVFGDGFDIF